MRDIGIVIWAILLIVGVIGSIASKVRGIRTVSSGQPRAAGARLAAMRALQGPAAPQATVTVAPAATVSRPPTPRMAAPSPPEHRETRAAFRFPGRTELARAVIAAEVLGKPRALRDEYSPHI